LCRRSARFAMVNISPLRMSVSTSDVLPVIDLEGYINQTNRNKAAAAELCARVAEALRLTGCLVVR
jgi:hypothetical protein